MWLLNPEIFVSRDDLRTPKWGGISSCEPVSNRLFFTRNLREAGYKPACRLQTCPTLACAQCIVLLVIAIAAMPVAAATRRALVIGINTYEPPPGETAVAIQFDPAVLPLLPPDRPPRKQNSFHNLTGAVADANTMHQILIDRFELAPENIRVLEDRAATRAAILAAIPDALAPPGARKGDIGVFFFAGHGSQMFNSKSPEQDRLDETLSSRGRIRGRTRHPRQGAGARFQPVDRSRHCTHRNRRQLP